MLLSLVPLVLCPWGGGGGVLAVQVIEWPIYFMLIDSEDVDDIFLLAPLAAACV